MHSLKRYKSLPVIIILAIALPLFIWALVNLNFNQNKKAASGEPIDIVAGEPTIGPENALVVIVAYADFQCPSCKSFVDDTMQLLLESYPTQVKFVFKDFPLITTHPLAERAAIAGQCAFEQDKFWEMHDLIFAKQGTLSEADLGSEFPYQLGLDMAIYNTCYSNRETLAEVQDDMTEGNFKGVTGTPTFYINGTPLVGAHPFSNFKAIIDPLIVKQGDVNGDGHINMIDIGDVVDEFDSTNPSDPRLDVDGKGKVDLVDIGIIVDNYEW